MDYGCVKLVSGQKRTLFVKGWSIVEFHRVVHMNPKSRPNIRALSIHLAMVLLAMAAAGCQSFFNSWLDPTQVGDFGRETTTQIRTSLSIQDTPAGIPGAEDPRPEDLVPVYEEYRVGSGDVLSIRIFELLARNTETSAQPTVDEIGTVALPVLGQVRVAGMTRSEITEELIDLLAERGIVHDATVVVEIPVKRSQTYVVFGATPGANLYPLARPNTRLLEALNTAGGLLDAVTELYVIRQEAVTAPGTAVGAAWTSDPRRPYSLSDGFGYSGAGGGPYAYAGRSEPAPQDPPPDQNQKNPSDETELMEAATPPVAQPNEKPKEASVPGESTPPEPAGQPRWIFVNGEWVETKVSQNPPTAPTPSSSPPGEVPGETPASINTPNVPPPPDTLPQIDWNRLSGDTQTRVIRISVAGLRDGDNRQNIIVRNGDVIRVIAGQVGEYYIMGQVGRPGAYSITGRRVTLKTAIASAGNLAPLAWPDRCTIYRRYGDREEMHQVNLDAIFAGKESDLLVKNYDLILVGTHPVAPFLAVFRNAFRLTYGFGFVYDRNFGDIDSFSSKINPSNRPRGSGSRFPNLFN